MAWLTNTDVMFQKGILVLLFCFWPLSAAIGGSIDEDTNLRTDLLEFDNQVDATITGSIAKGTEQLSYCLNISDLATETRHAILTKRLLVLEAQVDSKLDELAGQIEILKTWTKKREDFIAKANESLVQIFQSMRPDAAALQLTEVGTGMAAAIISKLEPKYSSAILTEMKPEDAAKIAMVLTKALANNDKTTN